MIRRKNFSGFIQRLTMKMDIMSSHYKNRTFDPRLDIPLGHRTEYITDRLTLSANFFYV